MKLTRKKAIELCIELWEWLAKTGEEKVAWPEWDKYENIFMDCWFCEYRNQQTKRHSQDTCGNCPYFKKYGKCYSEGGKTTYYDKWEFTETPRTRKKYAKLFLAQIKSLK